MTKAVSTPITAAASRRSLLAAGPLAAIAAAMPSITLGQVQGEQELIALCNRHIENVARYNAGRFDGEFQDDPLWQEYERTRAAIFEAKPRTLAGMAAIARAAKAEALQPNGEEDFRNCASAQWAWNVMHEILQMAGGVA